MPLDGDAGVCHASVRRDASGAIVGVGQDITERKAQQARLDWTSALINIVNLVQGLFMAHENRAEVFDVVLSDIISQISSEHGFIDEVLHTEEGSPYWKTLAITDISWDEAKGIACLPICNVTGEAT